MNTVSGYSGDVPPLYVPGVWIQGDILKNVNFKVLHHQKMTFDSQVHLTSDTLRILLEYYSYYVWLSLLPCEYIIMIFGYFGKHQNWWEQTKPR